MSLQDGYYQIASVTSLQPIIGRNPIEDRSMQPKGVFALPSGTLPLLPWIVKTPLGGQGLVFEAGGAPTAPISDKLYAILQNNIPPMEWVVTPAPAFGPFAYSVQTSDRERGWIALSDEPLTQVSVKPLTSPNGGALTPNEVFIFEKVPGV
ncbi:hypothetical protein QCA50_007765 [Cerrena zonata]|uniref:Uncharacterized protein n=1 Tax=Cerrena zonata TaxID=2478898 RepID=A0AAW0GCK9_9APHY